MLLPKGKTGMSERKFHVLKTKPVFYDALIQRKKTAEVRRNDRGFAVGDVCILRPWSNALGFLSEGIIRQVTHILTHDDFPGVAEGYVVLSFGDAL